MKWLLSVDNEGNGYCPLSIHDTRDDCLRAAIDYDYANLRLGLTFMYRTSYDNLHRECYACRDVYEYPHYFFRLETVPYSKPTEIDADLIDQSR